jgi:hypothetical protein
VIIVNDDITLKQTIESAPGIMVVYIYTPGCPACQEAEKVFGQSTHTIQALDAQVVKCISGNCLKFCEEHQIDGVPALFLFQNGKFLSMMNYAPTQDQFLFWLTNSIED